jgi:hypothetical protein
LSKAPTYVPKHRHAPTPTVTAVPRRILRSTVLLTSLAAAATGVAVSGGVLASPAAVNAAADDLGAAVTGSDTPAPTREPVVSRAYDRREGADPVKAAALSVDEGPAVTRTVDIADGDPRDIARALLPDFGFGADQFGCLDSLWTRESHWNPAAHNSSSGAHGIPQSMPGSKMASVGADWATNPVTQITWGLGYIRDRWGTPCGAWAHSEARGWY